MHQNTQNWKVFQTCKLSKLCNPSSLKAMSRNNLLGDTTTGIIHETETQTSASTCYFFRYLTNQGIEYLRTILHLPPEIVPSTLKRQARTETTRARPAPFKSETSTKPAEDRAGYRRTPGGPGADKKADVGAGTADLEFVSFGVNNVTKFDIVLLQRGGFGRGRSAQQ